MRRFPRLSGRLAALLAAGGVGLVLPLLPVAASAAGGNATCSGGSVAAGTYQSLTVTGFCSVDSGAVTVTKNLTVAPGAALVAAFGGAGLHVRGHPTLGSPGSFGLGCGPEGLLRL